MVGERSRTTPLVPGCCRSAPNTADGSRSARSPTTSSMPIGSARAATTAIVCGWVSASTKNAAAACLVDRRIERHRLGRRGGLVEHRRVGDLHAGEVRDHRLEVEERLEPALADLGLVRRVGRVPGRVLEHVAQDHAGGVGAVSSRCRSARSPPGCGRRGSAAWPAPRAPTRASGSCERLVGADGLGHRLVDQLVERGHAEDGEHALDVLGAGPEVAIGEGGGGGGLGHRGLRGGRWAWIPRCRLVLQRRLPRVVLGLRGSGAVAPSAPDHRPESRSPGLSHRGSSAPSG